MSEQHRRNVAALPCIKCGIEAYSQAAHANNHVFGKGRSIKSDDLATFPLCCDRPGIIGCHTKHDRYIDITKEEANELEISYVLATLITLGQLGKLKAIK